MAIKINHLGKLFMAQMDKTIEVIILAAGSSSRLGQAKQLVQYQGKSLLVRQCEMALAITDKVSCVLGCRAQEMNDAISHLPIKKVLNENWQNGLSSSIAKGISSISTEVDAVMLILVDQWQLTILDLQHSHQQWQQTPNNIVSATMLNENKVVTGPPVIFPRYCFPSLSQLNQQRGAKKVIHQYQEKLITLDMPTAFVDLDTPEQLKILQQQQN